MQSRGGLRPRVTREDRNTLLVSRRRHGRVTRVLQALMGLGAAASWANSETIRGVEKLRIIRWLAVAAFTLTSSAVFVSDAGAQQADKDGCFVPRRNCVAMTGEWKRNRFVSRYTNNCQGRIYLKFCNYRKGKRPDSGASGVARGRTKAWSTSSGATGRYAAVWVGSMVPSKDWVCAGKVRNWRNSCK